MSGLVFLCCMAIENAVAASIPDPDTQKKFDRISLYFGVSCFVVIHIVALAFVITKVRSLAVLGFSFCFMYSGLESQVFTRLKFLIVQNV